MNANDLRINLVAPAPSVLALASTTEDNNGRLKESLRRPKRFALAHELGHWLLHRNISQVLACTSENMVAKYFSASFGVGYADAPSQD
jgi:hypothetical protein